MPCRRYLSRMQEFRAAAKPSSENEIDESVLPLSDNRSQLRFLPANSTPTLPIKKLKMPHVPEIAANTMLSPV